MQNMSSSSSSSAPNNNKKRTFGAVIRTLNDVTNVGSSAKDAATITNGIIGSSSNSSGGNSNSNVTTNNKIIIQHIPNLDNEASAAAILQRVHSEFGTLINKRGWNIKSITEMCCCGDGLDHCCTSTSRKRTPLKIMPNNVLGYNRSSFIKYSNTNKSSSHDIHLRLRHPTTHILYDYESIASTMCHELAHCVRGPHDVQFYKAMDEIEEQYQIYLVKGVILDKDGFPMGSQGMTLGRNSTSSFGNGGGGTIATNKAAINRIMAEAAEARRSKSGSQNGLTTCGGYVLGSSSSNSGDDTNKKMKDPRDAARIAAERRLDDAKFCLPSNEIIELLGDDDDDTDNDDDDDLDVKPKAKTKTKKEGEKDSGIIDLTLDDSLDDSFTTTTITAQPPNNHGAKKRIKADMIQSSSSLGVQKVIDTPWSCNQCTLFNPSTILVCMACHSERPCQKSVMEHATELHKADAIDYIKEREVQISKETFGGFNIYGEKKKKKDEKR